MLVERGGLGCCYIFSLGQNEKKLQKTISFSSEEPSSALVVDRAVSCYCSFDETGLTMVALFCRAEGDPLRSVRVNVKQIVSPGAGRVWGSVTHWSSLISLVPPNRPGPRPSGVSRVPAGKQDGDSTRAFFASIVSVY